MRRLAPLCALALAGCADWSAETRIEEAAYQTANVVDAVQSYHQARTPKCFVETDPLTKGLLGEHPVPRNALIFRAAWGGLHASVTGMLENQDAPLWARRTWQFLTIGTEAREVGHNWKIGITLTKAPCNAPT